MENLEVTKARWDEMQKKGKELLDEIEGVLKKYEVTRMQMMIQTKDGVVLDHDFQVGVVDKLGLIELARINASTRQSAYVNINMVREAEFLQARAEKSSILKPV